MVVLVSLSEGCCSNQTQWPVCFLWNQSNKDNYSSLPNTRHQLSDFMIDIELHYFVLHLPKCYCPVWSDDDGQCIWLQRMRGTKTGKYYTVKMANIRDTYSGQCNIGPQKSSNEMKFLYIFRHFGDHSKGMCLRFQPAWHNADLKINASKHKICRSPSSSSPILNDIPLQQLFASTSQITGDKIYLEMLH